MLNKKKKRGNKSTASYGSSILPEELIIMILLKLPMRSITCCKCVCKSWQKLISDASFRNSYMSALPSSFLPTWAIYRKWPLEILYDPLAKKTMILLDPKFDGLPKPLLDFFGEKVIPCASSHGLLCCSSETTTGLLYICNPMTREFKALPVPDEQFDFVPFAGFSYSPSTGRFMVAVRAWHSPAILVFTSPFGGWRKLYILQGTCRINPVIVGHRLYFLLRDGRCMTILDTQEEKWNIIILPVGIDGRDLSVKIVRWDDYVCLVKISRVDGLVVWILSEENEWGEARRMEARSLPELNDNESFIPLDVCGRFLYVIGSKMLFIYDLEGGILQFGGFTTQKIVTACETFAYKPTLYSITL